MITAKTEHSQSSGSAESVVLVKASPQVGRRHGETVCCAGIDIQGKWLRLYPVSFRILEDRQKFARWDRIRFKWRLPKDDNRPESRRVDHETVEIVGKLKSAERERFLANSIVTGLQKEREAGRSLALLRPQILDFVIDKKPQEELAEEKMRFDALRAQSDLFSKQTTPYHPCPYSFRYRYLIDEGKRFGTCQDWETEATFYNWSEKYGEAEALAKMRKLFGEDYPKKGMALAMGTHSQYPDRWLINGVIRLDSIKQSSFF